MAKKQKPEGLKVGLGAWVALAAVVVVLLAFVYLNPQKAQDGKGTAALQAESPAAKLLLSAYDKGAGVGAYAMNYSLKDEQGEVFYFVSSNGTHGYVMESRPIFGVSEGWFGKNESQDILCLRNRGDYYCAVVGVNAEAKKIAASLKAWLPNREVFAAQKKAFEKHIQAGALAFKGEIVEEKVGGFDARKIVYETRYGDLTVRQLSELGISPDATPQEREVTYWIDKATGMIVKAAVVVEVNGVPYGISETTYYSIEPKARIPPAPEPATTTAGFVQMYKVVARNYLDVTGCLSLGRNESWQCLKNLAVEKRSWDVCKFIKNTDVYEQCTMIVAHDTYNEVLCGKLTKYADDCYISVVSVKGNFEACRLLKNQSLMEACSAAAARGKKLQDERLEQLRRLEASKNCKTDADCFVPASASHLCVPKNATAPFGEAGPYAKCFENLPCGCQDGFCGFVKNETYYDCVKEVEDRGLEEFIHAKINESRSGQAAG
ncbi:MAG: hypothetical protein N3E51_00485 [Candidatus Micrarchaeota archaeon]|nr:hypothetical protein [Candidatus Micrarchaeota archaeon]